jgi:predicted nucleic acid-binding protein
VTTLVDTTIISNFAAVGRLDLLRSVLGPANIADTVLAELHHGADQLAIARRRGWALFTDDRAARARARRWGIRVGGTIGLLLEMTERQFLGIDEANALLQEMVARTGYRSPIEDLRML